MNTATKPRGLFLFLHRINNITTRSLEHVARCLEAEEKACSIRFDHAGDALSRIAESDTAAPRTLVFTDIEAAVELGADTIRRLAKENRTVLELRADILEYEYHPLVRDAARLQEIINLCRHIDIIITPSAYSKERLTMPGMDADRIRVMRRGVMPGIPQGPQAVIHDGHRDQAFQLITTSGLLWSKGHDRILETASELRRRGIAFRWILTGDGPNHEWLNFELHRRQLEDVVIPPRRRWTAKAIHRALAESDLYVQLPRSEYMGYCMMDAAAVGLPCLSTETGMIREVFTHGETALLIDPFRAAALADRIISLMQDIDLRKQLAKKSREMICRTYTVDNYIDGYRKLCTT